MFASFAAFFLSILTKCGNSYATSRDQLVYFWQQLEQMVFIVRLPFELMWMIGKFFYYILQFLQKKAVGTSLR